MDTRAKLPSYSETIEIIYASNHFMATRHDIRHPSSFPSQERINAIRSLSVRWLLPGTPPFGPNPDQAESHYGRLSERQLTDWERIWGVLASMQGLRRLRVELGVSDTY